MKDKKENIWDKAYEMEVGERLDTLPNANSHEYLIRVPGGWVYGFGSMQGETSVFIPFYYKDPTP